MNREKAKEIINILNTEVNDLLNKHGLQIDVGNASFSATTVTFKSLRINAIGSLNKEGEQLASHIEYLQKYSKWLLKTHEPVFINNNNIPPQRYKLGGYSPRAKKFPYIIEDMYGDQAWKIKEETARKHFGFSNKNYPDHVEEGTPLHEVRIAGFRPLGGREN